MPGITASLTDVVLTKQCTACQEKLPATMFYKQTACQDGLSYMCKKCMDKRRGKHVKENPVQYQTAIMVRGARNRAKLKQLNFDINLEYVRSLVVTHCPILGIPLEWSTMRGNGMTTVPGSPSLDRIDPTKGYISGNVWIISHRANAIKNNATHEELKLVARAVGKALVESLEF